MFGKSVHYFCLAEKSMSDSAALYNKALSLLLDARLKTHS